MMAAPAEAATGDEWAAVWLRRPPTWADYEQIKARLAAEQVAIAGNAWLRMPGGLAALREPDGGLRGYDVPRGTRARWKAMQQRMDEIAEALAPQRPGAPRLVRTPVF